MIPRKFKVGFASFPYGGNGGMASESPDLKHWWAKTRLAIEKDDRVEKPVWMVEIVDTPITMTRNAAAKRALDGGVDCLVMYDSDMHPDLLLGIDPEAKPFWETAFDLFCRQYDRGPCIVAAPYCGCPPHPMRGGSENPHVFTWRNHANHPDMRLLNLRTLSREEAALRTGVERVPAIGTGLILIDTRVFKQVPPPWFEYHYADPPYNTRKDTTEDVWFTRNASMLGIPVYVLWECWAGHHKPYTSGKPMLIREDEVCEPFREAVRRGIASDERMVDFNAEQADHNAARDCEQLPGDAVPLDEAPSEAPVALQMCDDGFLRVGWACDPTDYEHLREALQPVVAKAIQDGMEARIVEIGSWVGESAIVIHDAFPEGLCRVICVDTWEGDPNETQADIVRRFGGREKMLATFRRNTMGRRIEPIVGDSAETGRNWKDGPLDCVWIDGGHEYEQVRADILAWLPHIRDGGILCGHDHSDSFPGVVRAVWELLGDVEVRGSVWSTQVTHALKARLVPRDAIILPAEVEPEIRRIIAQSPDWEIIRAEPAMEVMCG